MSHDLGGRTDPDADHQPRDSTASDEADSKNEVSEPRMVDQAERDDSFADSDEEFSLVDPLMYAPLILVGTALVVFPEPATSLVGVPCLVAGLFLAVMDLLSPSAVA